MLFRSNSDDCICPRNPIQSESESISESEGTELDTRSVPEPDSMQPEISLPLNTGEEFPVLKNSIDEWTNLYPAVDVMQELRNMRGWCLANPTRRKTMSGIERFIVQWLAQEQNSGKTKKPKVSEQTVNGKALGDALLRKMMEG